MVAVLFEIQNSFIASPYTMRCRDLDPQGQALYTGSAFAISIGLAGATTATVLIASVLTSFLTASAPRIVLLNLSLIIAPLLAREFARRVCFAHFKIGEVLRLDGLVSIIQIGGLLLLSRIRSHSIREAYCLIGVSSGLVALAWAVSWRKRTRLTVAGALHTLRNTWSFGAWVLTGNLALVLSQQIYPWYLASFKGPNITGIFAACLGLLALINPLISASGNYLGPWTANAATRGSDALLRVILRATFFLTGIVGVFCLIIITFGNRLLLILYGIGYHVDIRLLVVLALSVLVSNAGLAMGFGFWAINRPDINLKINIIATISAATAGPWLVNSQGLMGAACGLLIANTSVSAIRLLLLRQMLDRA